MLVTQAGRTGLTAAGPMVWPARLWCQPAAC